MAGVTTILDGDGGGRRAIVTQYGQLVTAPLDFSLAYNATAGTANTAANLLVPKPNQRFIITGIILYANQNVSNVTDATVVVYEAASSTTTTVATTLLETNMVRQDRVVLTGLNLIVSEGAWVNLKTTDDDVYGTILGYYVYI